MLQDMKATDALWVGGRRQETEDRSIPYEYSFSQWSPTVKKKKKKKNNQTKHQQQQIFVEIISCHLFCVSIMGSLLKSDKSLSIYRHLVFILLILCLCWTNWWPAGILLAQMWSAWFIKLWKLGGAKREEIPKSLKGAFTALFSIAHIVCKAG